MWMNHLTLPELQVEPATLTPAQQATLRRRNRRWYLGMAEVLAAFALGVGALSLRPPTCAQRAAHIAHAAVDECTAV